MAFEEIEITYENLFKLIELEEKIEFTEDVEYFQKTKLKIKDENGFWVDIKGLIKKWSDTIEISVNTGAYLKCAKTHLIKLSTGELVSAEKLRIGDSIHNFLSEITTVEEIRNSGFCDVYDIEVDSETHLYQCSLGFIHHNTLLTSAIIKYANKLNMRTITIVPSSSLLKQTYNYIKQFEIPVGMFGGGKKDDSQNIVATWQTLQNNKTFIQDFECVIWDECVHPSSKIRMGDNTEKRIDEIVAGDLVKTYNEETGNVEINPVLRIHKNLKKSDGQIMFKLTMEDGSIVELTGNHEVLTDRGWIRCDELQEKMVVISCESEKSHVVTIEDMKYTGDVYNLHVANNHNYFVNGNCVKNCHTAKAYVAQQIMQQAINSYMRIGLTGTIPKDSLDKANLLAAFGPVTYHVKAHELQERKVLSTITISVFELIYPKEYVNSFIDWHDETVFLQSNEMFVNFIKALSETLNDNILILMKNIDPAEELAKELNCTYISSKLNVDKRQEKFDEFVHGGNHIAVGTYSLLSTGIDIVHIHNIILAPTPGKSFCKCLQSIGRGLRRKEGQKEHVNVIDLTSNLKFDRKHIKDRKDYYKEAKYPFECDKMEMEQFKLEKKDSKNKK